MTTSFSDLMAAVRSDGDATVLDAPDDWMQGRSVFGGLQLAVALRAMRRLAPTAPLRTLQATFVAPLGGRLAARARTLRVGKNATHVEARLLDGDETAVVAIGVFGTARRSVAQVTPVQPEVPDETGLVFPFIPGLTPNFIQHFDVKMLRGQPPFSGVPVTRAVLDVSLREDARAAEEHVVAIADFVPPLALTHLSTPAPGSTLTWMLEMIAHDIGTLPVRGWRVDVELASARDGYTSQSVMIWGPGGVPVALSRQSMLVFG